MFGLLLDIPRVAGSGTVVCCDWSDAAARPCTGPGCQVTHAKIWGGIHSALQGSHSGQACQSAAHTAAASPGTSMHLAEGVHGGPPSACPHEQA